MLLFQLLVIRQSLKNTTVYSLWRGSGTHNLYIYCFQFPFSHVFSLSLSPITTVFCHLFTHCKGLQVLNLKCCSLIDDTAVITLIQNSSFLASLCLSGCYMISDRSIKAVANTCKYMQALDLSRTKVSPPCPCLLKVVKN